MKTSTHLLYGMVMTSLLCSPAWAAEKVGVVGAAGATLTIIGENQQARSAKTGDDVFLGDVLKTDGSGKAQVVFLDRSSITLKPNSDLTVDSFVYDPSSESGKLALKSAKGAFRFIGGALSKKKPVTLTTPVGTIGIRGGIADTTIAANGETDAFFLYGEEMSMSNANGEQVSTKQYGSGITLDSSTATPQPASLQQVAAHLDGFRPSTNDPALPGAPDAGDIDQKMDIGTDSQSPLASADTGAETPVASNGNTSGEGGNGGNNGGGESGTAANSPTSSESGSGKSGSSSSSPQTSTSLAAVKTAPALDAPSALPWLANNGTSGAPIQTSNLINTATQTSTDNAVTFVARSGTVEPGGTLSLRTGSTQLTSSTTDSPPPRLAPPQYFGRYSYRREVFNPATGEFSLPTSSGGIAGNLQNNVYTLTFNEKFPNDGASYEKNFIRTPTTGLNNAYIYSASPGLDLTWDDKLWTGWVIGSDSGSFQYYQLKDYLNPSEQFSMVIGTPVLLGSTNIQSALDTSRAVSNAENTGNVGFFQFLPSFFDHHNTNTAQNGVGFLDYNIFQPAVTLAQYGYPPVQNSQFGLAANWEMKSFFTGNLQWDSSTNDVLPYLKAAFGKIDPNGGTVENAYFNGRAYSFDGLLNNTTLNSLVATNDFDYESGFIRADRNLYGTAANGIDGLMLNLSSSTGEHDSQMAVRVNGSTLAPNVQTAAQQVSASTAPKTQFGFVGGAYIKDAGVGESNELAFLTNSNVRNVSMTQGPDGQVGARIIADNRSTDTIEDDVIVAKFGATSGRDSAYVADQIWGAQQGVVIDTTRAVGVDATGADNYNTGLASAPANQGALIGATFTSTATPTCTSCQFVQWGVWAGNQEMGTGRVDVANLIPVVVGEVTQNLGSKTLTGNATYAGPAYGTFAKTAAGSTNITNATGNVNAVIDLSTKSFAAGAIDMSFANVNGQQLFLTNVNSVNFTAIGNAVNTTPIALALGNTPNPTGAGAVATVSSMNTALFGPNAENIGGNFYVKKLDYYGTNTTLEGAGVFLGVR